MDNEKKNHASSDKLKCPTCGAQNSKGTIFCAKCGASLINQPTQITHKISSIVSTFSRDDSKKGKLSLIKDFYKRIQGKIQQRASLSRMIIVAVGVVLVIFFLQISFDLFENIFNPNKITIGDSVGKAISTTGGTLEFYDLRVEVPRGVVGSEDEFLGIGLVKENSLPVKLPNDVELIGNVYAINWLSPARINPQPIELTFFYSPEDLPEGTSADDLAILSFDGEQWLRIPCEGHPETRSISAQVSHFSLKALVRYTLSGFSRREVADRTIADIHFTGQVGYEIGKHAKDTHTQTAPAANFRYAVIDTDGILLHEDNLSPYGSFDFILPSGTDVGLDLDVILRVYAEDPTAGKVLDEIGMGAEPWRFTSYDTLSFSLSSNRIDFGSIVVKGEDSAFFNILHALKRSRVFLPESEPDPISVVWGGPQGKKMTNLYDSERNLIYLSGKPQTAWDDDLVIRLFGEYFYQNQIRQNSTLECEGKPTNPDKRTNPCRALIEGWGYFYSSAVRSEEFYQLHQNQETIQISYDLESGDFPNDQRYSGTVMQVLWDLMDENDDGESCSMQLDTITNLLQKYGKEIDSLRALFDFWSTNESMSRKSCSVFCKHGIATEEECDQYTSDMVQPSQPDFSDFTGNTGTIAYGAGSEGTLKENTRDRWLFEGSQGDSISIFVTATDTSVLPQVKVRLQGESENIIELKSQTHELAIADLNLPENGTYEVIVWFSQGSGDYAISLNRKSTSAPTPTSTTQPMQIPSFTPSQSSPAATQMDLMDEQIPIEVGYRPLVYNQTISGEHSGCCNHEGWYFAGQAGDRIDVDFHANPEDADSRFTLWLFDPKNHILELEDGTDIYWQDIELPDSGWYSIQITLDFKDMGGDYQLEISSNNSPPSLSKPQRRNSFLSFNKYGDYYILPFSGDPQFPLDHEVVVYTFEGHSGDQIDIACEVLSGDLDPYIDLLDEDGQVLGTDDDSLGYRGSCIRNKLLPKDGYYLVEVRFHSGYSGEIKISVAESSSVTIQPQFSTAIPESTSAPLPAPTPTLSESTCNEEACRSLCINSYRATTGFCKEGKCTCHCNDATCASQCSNSGYRDGYCDYGKCTCE